MSAFDARDLCARTPVARCLIHNTTAGATRLMFFFNFFPSLLSSFLSPLSSPLSSLPPLSSSLLMRAVSSLLPSHRHLHFLRVHGRRAPHSPLVFSPLAPSRCQRQSASRRTSDLPSCRQSTDVSRRSQSSLGCLDAASRRGHSQSLGRCHSLRRLLRIRWNDAGRCRYHRCRWNDAWRCRYRCRYRCRWNDPWDAQSLPAEPSMAGHRRHRCFRCL